MSGFHRTKTDRVGDYRVFEVFRHQMADGNGRGLRDAFTVVCPDWVSVVPVTEDGKFVLVRQYRPGIDGPTLEVPGGMIDPGEDPATAALRELREETGYGAGSLVPLGATHPNPVLQSNRHHMFLARGLRRLGEPAFDVGESCEVLLLESDEMRARARDGTITHALVLLSLERAFAVLDAEGRQP
jgi:ADP-ribose pyrophosphatase